MTADTLARLCRALGVSAPALTAAILDGWPDSQTVEDHARLGPLPAKKTRRQAEEWRKAGHPRAYRALATLLPRDIACLGIDPGRNGAMVGLDPSGAVVLEVALGSLFVDEATDGPAAKRRARSQEQAAIREANKARPPSRQLKGRRKKVESVKGARWRLDPLALRWLFETLKPTKVVLEGLLFHNLALTTWQAKRMGRDELIYHLNRAREGVKSTATMQANWERLAMALRYAGIDYEECTPSVWQAGWSSKDDAEELLGDILTTTIAPWLPQHRFPSGAELRADPKARSIAAARLAGYDTTNDALADAFGLARWGMRV